MRIFTEEHKRKLRLARRKRLITGKTRMKMHFNMLGNKLSTGKRNTSGEHHWNWKADSVKYSALHIFLRKHIPLPKYCQKCGRQAKLDLANVTGIYDRNFKNWLYLCRRCHVHLDGNVKNLKHYGDL